MTISMPRADMMTVLRKLGLTTSLKLCLDAGHELSVTSTAWEDLSGGGDGGWYRGGASAGDAQEPTFNGVEGNRSSSEYWSFDGGDYFTYWTANKAWMETLHKNNAKFTLAAWIWINALGVMHPIFMSCKFVGTDIGINFMIYSDDKILLYVVNGTTVAMNSSIVARPAALATGKWYFVAVSCDEALGASGGLQQVNGEQTTFDATYASPSAAAASPTGVYIGVQSGAAQIFKSGDRIANCMAWEGRVLNAGELQALFQATRPKFGV